MTDEEYREFLAALAAKYLRIQRLGLSLGPESRYAWAAIERLSSISRLTRVVAERQDERSLLQVLGRELEHANLSFVRTLLEESGTLAALEDSPEIVFGQLRRSVIPAEDFELLRRAGVEDPEAELTIWIHFARLRMSSTDVSPTDVLSRAEELVSRVGKRLEASQEVNSSSKNQKPRRKPFNGIGKILSGAVAGAGNVLLGVGVLVAPNPAIGVAVIASAALAISGVFQGIGDLRGE